MEIMSSPWPLISLIKADPPAVIRYETCTGSPSEFFPSQEPLSDFSWLNDFCASDCPNTAVADSNITMHTAMRNAFIFIPPEKLFVFCPMAGSFFFILGFYKSFQISQAGLPEHAVLLQP